MVTKWLILLAINRGHTNKVSDFANRKSRSILTRYSLHLSAYFASRKSKSQFSPILLHISAYFASHKSRSRRQNGLFCQPQIEVTVTKWLILLAINRGHGDNVTHFASRKSRSILMCFSLHLTPYCDFEPKAAIRSKIKLCNADILLIFTRDK